MGLVTHRAQPAMTSRNYGDARQCLDRVEALVGARGFQKTSGYRVEFEASGGHRGLWRLRYLKRDRPGGPWKWYHVQHQRLRASPDERGVFASRRAASPERRSNRSPSRRCPARTSAEPTRTS